MFDNGGWRAGVMHRDPMYMNLAIALGRRSPDGDVLVSAISAVGVTTELIGESEVWDRPLRIPVDAARALYDALAQHFGGTSNHGGPHVTGIVHIVGTVVDVGSRTRQCCAWCGTLLLDYDLTRIAVPLGQDATAPSHFPPGVLLEVDGNCKAVIEHQDGDVLPDNACVRLDIGGTNTKPALAWTLAQIERNDTNYVIRYGLVWQALALAVESGIGAGVRIDPAEPEWPVVYIDLPSGQVSWHMPQFADAWDGHDTAEKYRRVRAFVEAQR